MPTPKLPMSSSCRGISGAKITNPNQQSIEYSLPPPSATAPITTPVSSHSSQSPSPLAVSEIARNQKQYEPPQKQEHQVLLQPRKQQTTSVSNRSNGSSERTKTTGIGLRRAGHFLAHGSGTAEGHTSRPETITQRQVNNHVKNPTKINTTNHLVQPRSLQTNSKIAVPSHDNAALRAPRLMSGFASPDNIKSVAPTATTPTAGKLIGYSMN